MGVFVSADILLVPEDILKQMISIDEGPPPPYVPVILWGPKGFKIDYWTNELGSGWCDTHRNDVTHYILLQKG